MSMGLLHDKTSMLGINNSGSQAGTVPLSTYSHTDTVLQEYSESLHYSTLEDIVAMARKLEFEVEVKTSAEMFWASLTSENMTLLPKAMPHVYQSIEALEGDGTSTGSIRLIKFAPGVSASSSSVTQKLELVDEVNKTLCYTLLDGETLEYLKTYRSTFVVSSKEDGSSIVKFNVEFEKASDKLDGGDLYKDFVTRVLQDLDAYLLNA